MEKCQCSGAGYCPIFNRDVSRDDWDLCSRGDDRGLRCRKQWAREAGLLAPPSEASKPPDKPTGHLTAHSSPPTRVTHDINRGPRKIVLVLKQCPGDTLASTAALESLASQYPGRYLIGIDSGSTQAVYEYNPHVQDLRGQGGVERIDWHYPLIQQATQRPVHFMMGYTSHLSEILGVPVELTVNRPYLYLSEKEKAMEPQVPGKYWIINAGWKNCFETKRWLPERYQEVVDRLQGKVRIVQIGMTAHHHPKLRGVIDLIDKTSIRDLIRLVYHAQGAIGPGTFLELISAAWNKPYVMVDSARETASWLSFPSQASLVKHGKLRCCAERACWKTKLSGTQSVCEDIFTEGSIPVPRCSAMITADDVVRSIESFYEGGRLVF